MAAAITRTSSIVFIVLQACVGYRIRMHTKTAEIANRHESQVVVGTLASELTRRCDKNAFKIYCTNIPEDCSKALCQDCEQCIRTNPGQHDHLRRSGEYKPAFRKPDTCNAHWRMGKYLDKGAMGEILQVRKSREEFGQYVLKKALTNDTQKEIESEVKIMSQIKCPGILNVEDPAPCDESGKKIPYSFVMPQMVPNLWKWYDKYPAHKRICRDTIERQLSEALTCLHSFNFVHGDFKGDQVLYRGVDRNGCPVGLEISDFGLSHPRYDDEERPVYDQKYPADYYGQSGHLIGTMFEENRLNPHNLPKDPQSLTHPSDQQFYRISTKIDWCSFLFEMLTQLAEGDDGWFATLSIPSNLQGMDCGFMSGRRNIHVIAGR
jgi:tRNA A-37 threonylcarbamoyl transferase component Bud32|mmetsp:Transcript_23488/g.37582  ORF Transcript_23488/g.37582 Transcript_23488/m.37582 type:complete len:378 (-) Transcript_23488:67-1200(-)